MFNKLKIRTRIILGISVLLVVMMSVILPLVLSEFSSQIESAEQRELEKIYHQIVSDIDASGRIAEAMAIVVANTPENSSQFYNRQRDLLNERNQPIFKLLKKEFAVRQFQFHLPPATSFLRVHKPKKFGDDLSGFRKTVIQTNQSQQRIRGLEKGVAGIGIRGLAPVSHNGKHIGSVEFGMSFGQPFFDNFKLDHKVDVALQIPSEQKFKVFGSTFKVEQFSNTEQLRKIMQDNPIHQDVVIDDLNYTLYQRSITDFSGKPVGVVSILINNEESIERINTTRLNLIIIGIVALIIGIIIAYLLAGSIVNPINRATSAMSDIAQGDGDLTHRIETDSQDEVAELAQAFNLFVSKIHHTIEQVTEVTDSLASSAQQMSGITGESQHAAETQQKQTELAATAMNEMAATAQEVAQHASNAADAARQSTKATEGGKKAVGQTITTIEKLANEINESTDAIDKLEQDSKAIDSVLDVISNIAGQTNLLALNAAIEAARAGERGRGFAVVADEVRTLASRTQDSTSEIQNIIEQLQSAAQSTASIMRRSNETTSISVEQAKHAGEALDDIAEKVSTITEMNLQIANAANEQGAVSSEINVNINTINEGVSQISDNASQTSEASTNLTELSSRLKELINHFKI